MQAANAMRMDTTFPQWNDLFNPYHDYFCQFIRMVLGVGVLGMVLRGTQGPRTLPRTLEKEVYKHRRF